MLTEQDGCNPFSRAAAGSPAVALVDPSRSQPLAPAAPQPPTLQQQGVIIKMLIRSGFMSPKSTALEIEVDRETVYRWIREGKLRATRVGRQWRIRRADLEAFMSGRP